MLYILPDSHYHDAFRRHYDACARLRDQDLDLLTVTQGPWSCSSPLICGNNAVFDSFENVDERDDFGSLPAFVEQWVFPEINLKCVWIWKRSAQRRVFDKENSVWHPNKRDLGALGHRGTAHSSVCCGQMWRSGLSWDDSSANLPRKCR